LTVVAVALGYVCTSTGVLVADPTKGLVYPVDMHGTLYVTEAIGATYEHSLIFGVACLFAGGLLYKAYEYFKSEGT
jgi:hypothetical protein